MKARLTKFMRIEGLTAAKLAEVTNVQPSTISHILAGRNNPRYEFLAAIAKNFPKLNSRWLLLGEGDMYEKILGSNREEHKVDSQEDQKGMGLPLIMPEPEKQQTLELPMTPKVEEPPVALQTERASLVVNMSANNKESVVSQEEAQQHNTHDNSVLHNENKPKLRAEKIVIFNNDGTFEIYQN